MKARIGKKVQELELGAEAYFAKTMTETDMIQFAGITGDLNQLPTNEEFAKTTRFGTRIAHGMLTASLAASPAAKSENVVSRASNAWRSSLSWGDMAREIIARC